VSSVDLSYPDLHRGAPHHAAVALLFTGTLYLSVLCSACNIALFLLRACIGCKDGRATKRGDGVLAGRTLVVMGGVGLSVGSFWW
jgi:hypothetical protein